MALFLFNIAFGPPQWSGLCSFKYIKVSSPNYKLRPHKNEMQFGHRWTLSAATFGFFDVVFCSNASLSLISRESSKKTYLVLCFCKSASFVLIAKVTLSTRKSPKNFRFFAKIENFNVNFHIYPPGSAWQDLVHWKGNFSNFHFSYGLYLCYFLIKRLQNEILLVIFTKRR